MPCLQDLAHRFLDRFFNNAVVSMRYGRRSTLMVGDVKRADRYNNPDMMHDYIPDIIAQYTYQQWLVVDISDYGVLYW